MDYTCTVKLLLLGLARRGYVCAVFVGTVPFLGALEELISDRSYVPA
jgi:hypothetical protein